MKNLVGNSMIFQKKLKFVASIKKRWLFWYVFQEQIQKRNKICHPKVDIENFKSQLMKVFQDHFDEEECQMLETSLNQVLEGIPEGIF